MIAEMHLSTKKINLSRKNSMGVRYLNPLLKSIKFRSKKFRRGINSNILVKKM